MSNVLLKGEALLSSRVICGALSRKLKGWGEVLLNRDVPASPSVLKPFCSLNEWVFFSFFSSRHLEGWWYKQTKESKLYFTSLSRWAQTCVSILNFKKHQSFLDLVLFFFLPSTQPVMPEEKKNTAFEIIAIYIFPSFPFRSLKPKKNKKN